jgi:putative tricarboxylic transport membrane protein
MNKKIKFSLAAAASLALVLSGTYSASAVPASKAVAGTQCDKVNSVAKGKGVNGSDLTCLVIKTGTFSGISYWTYKNMKPVDSLEFVASSNIGGGYGLTAIATGEALKAEGLLKSYTVKYNSNAALGLGYFNGQSNRKDMLLVTGFAMPAGLINSKSTDSMLNTQPLIGFLREAEAIVVPTNSKYKTIKDLLADIKKSPKTVALGGGNIGGADQVTLAELAKTIGVAATDLNYVSYSGGGSIIPDIVSGRLAAAVSGTSEFDKYVEAGQLRALAITSPLPLKTMKGQTLIQQGIKMTFGNWRGLLAPKDLPAADYLNMLQVFDFAHNTVAWQAMLIDNSWIDEYRAGKTFTSWITKEVDAIIANLKAFKLA